MTAKAFIGVRVGEDVKAAFQGLAQQQGLSESALLKQLLGVMVGRTAAGQVAATPKYHRPKGSCRINLRLRGDDRIVLRERAAARDMRPATYASNLIRSHLRSLAPLPKKELDALMHTVHQLGAVGRNLNQIARVLNQGGRSAGPSREELHAVVKACAGLRDHVRSLIDANLKTWEGRL